MIETTTARDRQLRLGPVPVPVEARYGDTVAMTEDRKAYMSDLEIGLHRQLCPRLKQNGVRRCFGNDKREED